MNAQTITRNGQAAESVKAKLIGTAGGFLDNVNLKVRTFGKDDSATVCVLASVKRGRLDTAVAVGTACWKNGFSPVGVRERPSSDTWSMLFKKELR